MKPFVLNSAGRVVFPSTFLPELDFTVIDSLDQLNRVIKRDFESKSPTGSDILERIETGAYSTKFELMRDMALNLFWANRFAITMYDKRPTRWEDVPRRRDDVYLPVLTPWEDGEKKIAAVREAFTPLPPAWDAAAEEQIFGILFDVFGNRKNHATELPAVKPTVEEVLAEPAQLTFRLRSYDPDFPVFSIEDIIDAHQEAPELEALHRWAMVLHNQYPWDRSQLELAQVAQLRDDDYVVVFHPRNREVSRFLHRIRAGSVLQAETTRAPASPIGAKAPRTPYGSVNIRERFTRLPRIESLAVARGEHVCTNDDIIRNTAYNWSPMSAAEIADKTGIEQRLYTSRSLEEIALEAAVRALSHAGREPEEIGAVLFCSCTSTRLIPAVSAWLTGQLGMHQTHNSCDIIAACAGMPYGLAEAIRLLQEVERPVLLVCAEKFSDKIGTVRPSRMIFGDGAAAMVVGVAPQGSESDIDYVQTYAGGPVSEVNSIVWPNPAFDNGLTVYGPEVKSLAGRYLRQMIEEIAALPDPTGGAASLLESIDLIVPHQANKTMVTELAVGAGLSADQLYFNIEKVGNLSAASIPMALHDAVRDGVLAAPRRVFAPGFGAGAVGGYAVLRLDPAVVAISAADPTSDSTSLNSVAADPGRSMPDTAATSEHPSDDVREAFAG